MNALYAGDEVVAPPPAIALSPALERAIDAELAARPVEGGEATLVAAERVYAAQGEAPFDPLNSADMLIRAFVLAEAEDAANGRRSKP